jgi:hypothetical protein
LKDTSFIELLAIILTNLKQMIHAIIISFKMRILVINLILILTSLSSIGQTRQEKTDIIIKSLNLVEYQKMNYEFQIEPMFYQATGEDSMQIIELKKKLTEEEIARRINLVFSEVMSDEEVNDLYHFVQTTAFNKFLKSGSLFNTITSEFIDIDKEIEEINNSFSEVAIDNPIDKFNPIAIDKKDGIYATVDYKNSTENKDIKLEDDPIITIKDISEVNKEYNKFNGNKPEIALVLTKSGGRKFYLLTKKNIRKPLAIVIDKKIVSLPIVQSEIIGGKVNISGDFTESEIEDMIRKLRGE